MDLDITTIVAAERRRLARELLAGVWEAIAPLTSTRPAPGSASLQLPGSFLTVPVTGSGPAPTWTVGDTGVTVGELEALLATPVHADIVWVDEEGTIAGAVQAEGRGPVAVLRALAGFVASGFPPAAAAHAAPETLARPVRVQPPVTEAAYVEWHHHGDDLRLTGELTVWPDAGEDWRAATWRALALPPVLHEEDLVDAYAVSRWPGSVSATWDAAAGPYELSVSIAPC